MNYRLLIRQIIHLPPHLIIQKTQKVLRRWGKSKIRNIQDRFFSTYSLLALIQPSNNCYFDNVSPIFLSQPPSEFSRLSEIYLNHYFDLLGSGWIHLYEEDQNTKFSGMNKPLYGSESNRQIHSNVPANVNWANINFSNQIKSLLDPEFKRIAWQVDFKAHYSWLKDTYHNQIQYGHIPNLDVKVPWELGRFQHLSTIAIAQIFSKNQDQREKVINIYAKEFQNQLLNFISDNPPRFGVNWSCPMDVGIRAANWLMAWNLFNNNGILFEVNFTKYFNSSIYDHGLHIIKNLEWDPLSRSNQYLANITGLLFIAVHLPRSDEVDSWLAFAIQELTSEMDSQFNPDGTNFEGSTSYHRLSTEMMIYSAALILGLPKDRLEELKYYDPKIIKGSPVLKPPPISMYDIPGLENPTPLPPEFFQKLEKAAEFTMAITKPNREIVQIGDNDSGRLFKIQPSLTKLTVGEAKHKYLNLENYSDLPNDADYYDENILDHRHLVSAVNGLFNRKDFKSFADKFTLDCQIIKALSKEASPPSYLKFSPTPMSQSIRVGSEEEWVYWREKLSAFPQPQINSHEFISKTPSIKDELVLSAFPDFGLYIFRSRSFFLSIRLGPNQPKGTGGHFHNDQLSIELFMDGKDIITDPGTYLYTPNPQKRNEYRSTKAHFTPQIDDKELAPLNEGLFRLNMKGSRTCLYFGEKGFIGSHTQFGPTVYRVLELGEETITINDYVEGPHSIKSSHPTTPSLPLSNGYGKILRP
jgi:hypothetical protein